MPSGNLSYGERVWPQLESPLREVPGWQIGPKMLTAGKHVSQIPLTFGKINSSRLEACGEPLLCLYRYGVEPLLRDAELTIEEFLKLL